MVTRTVTIYEVPNSYVSSGGTVNISGVFTLTFDDDDGQLDTTAGADSGAPQSLTSSAGTITSYEFFYDDNSDVGGTTHTVKTFQMTIGGVTRSFVMNDDDSTIPGAGIGTEVDLNSFATYTPLDYTDLPCFVAGTLISVPGGTRLVEDLKVGDLVETLDHGPRPIRWIGRRTVSGQGDFAPICIGAGALGNSRDLYVSPQHRMLLSDWRAQLYMGEDEVLCPAKSLCRMDRVHRAPCDRVTYIHIMFDDHEIVFAEGIPSESFLAGEYICRDGTAVQEELHALFPELDTAHLPIDAARRTLRGFEGALCVG